MDYQSQLSDDLKSAMKAKDQVRLATVRGLKARIKEREIEKGETLTESEFLKVVQTAAKQRKDAMELYEQGGRADLVASERAELSILETYLPQMMSTADMTALVERVIAESGAESMRDMGTVMKELMAASQGRADGKFLQQCVREKLG